MHVRPFCTIGLLRYRGCRAPRRVRIRVSHRRSVTSSAGHVYQQQRLPTVVENRPPVHRVRLLTSQRTLVSIQRESFSQTIHCGVLNARLIGNTHAQIADCITCGKYDVFAVVETRHDSANCPNIIACTPSGYRCAERAHLIFFIFAACSYSGSVATWT